MVAVCIWEGIVWTLWKWRNARIFKGTEVLSDKVIDEIKVRLWSWIGTKDTRWNQFSFEEWRKNLRSVLGKL
ncbi:hypothetical protein ACS0TY_022029 [Phlomoides rotata]